MATAREELLDALGGASVGGQGEEKERKKHKRSNEMPHLDHSGPTSGPTPAIAGGAEEDEGQCW